MLKRITRNSYLYFTSSIFHYRKSHVVVQCFVCSYLYLRALWPIFQIVVSFSCQHTLLSDENNNIRIQLEVTTWYPYHITDFFSIFDYFVNLHIHVQGQIQDFKLIFLGGILCEKSRFYTKKSYFFSNFRGCTCQVCPPPACIRTGKGINNHVTHW